MKLTLRHEWRPRPFRSFAGILDLKIGELIYPGGTGRNVHDFDKYPGVQLALYFAVISITMPEIYH